MFSVIVPIAEGDNHWPELAKDLAHLPKTTEIILVSSTQPKNLKSYNAKWFKTDKQDAPSQMNFAARHAKGPFLWFLHSDSRLETETFSKLQDCVSRDSNAIYYFNLHGTEVSKFRWFKEIASKVRSELFGTHFRNQGFCLHKEHFKSLGGFPEKSSACDQKFLWKARESCLSIKPTKSYLQTGFKNLGKKSWIRQAIPGYLGTVKKNLFRRILSTKKDFQKGLLIICKPKIMELHDAEGFVYNLQYETETMPYEGTVYSAYNKMLRWYDFVIVTKDTNIKKEALKETIETIKQKNKFVVGTSGSGKIELLGGCFPITKLSEEENMTQNLIQTAPLHVLTNFTKPHNTKAKTEKIDKPA